MNTARATLLSVMFTLIVLSVRGVQFTTLASLAGPDGSAPNTRLAPGSDGNFYGTSFYGGDGDYGTVFKVATNGALTSLLSFATFANPTNGAYPNGSLTPGSDGNLYGTTFASGRTGGSGTVFRITTNGVLTTLAIFAGTNGGNPQGALIFSDDGNLYGTTETGGNGGSGTVFRMTTNGVLTTLAAFDSAVNDGTGTYTYTNVYGKYPGDLVIGSDGDFYGAAGSGGSGGVGTIFKVTTNGALSSLASFDRAVYDDVTGLYSNANGAYPNCKLTPGNDGCFYGITSDGGSNSVGTIFKVTTNGVLTSLFAFAPAGYGPNGGYTNANGVFPSGGLTLGGDGNFYGTTAQGGTSGSGTIFKFTTNGTLTTLIYFNGSNGQNPQAAPVLGGDGNFYGTTAQGGAYGHGTVFKLDTSTPTGIPLSILRQGNQAVLTWANPAFGLQSAPEIGGIFTNVPDAASPCTNDITGGQRYFRLIAN